MKKHLFTILCLIVAYTANANEILPVVNKAEFEGFEFSNKSRMDEVKITGYEFQAKDGRIIKFDNCAKSVAFGPSNIVGNERMHFQLFLVSCYALEKYLAARPSNKTYFPSKFEGKLIEHFPAVSMPLLYKAQARHRGDKSIKQYYSDVKVNPDKNGSIKLLSEEDEIYYSLMARGDFTNDGIEDLLIKSEWFSRKARGKHVDLLILSRKGHDQPITINWRLMQLN